MKNYVARTFVLTLIVVCTLLAMYDLPQITFDEMPFSSYGWAPSTYNGGSLRKVDLLGDLRRKDPEPESTIDSSLYYSLNEPVITDTTSITTDTTSANKDSIYVPPVAWLDTTGIPDSIVPIIDYGNDSSQIGMRNFYKSLKETKNRQVRIAWIGDSFVEGDILTGDLRAMLQKKYGGCGVGFMDIASPTSGFRQTVLHKHDKWFSYSYQEPKKFATRKQGLSKRYHIAQKGSWVEGRCHKYAYGNDSCTTTSLIYKNYSNCDLTLLLNKKDTVRIKGEEGDSLQFVKVDRKKITSARWIVDRADSAIFYGMTMDGETGIVLDNISLRGNSGSQMAGVPEKWLKEYNKIRPYDLIVIQFGLNVASKDRTEYKAYVREMKKVVEHLHNCMPQAGILIIGVGDRSYRGQSGEMESMPGVKNLSLYQQRLAKECGVAFWDLQKAMAKEGNMVGMVNHKPALANLDYTHINTRGGRKIAKSLEEAIEAGETLLEEKESQEAKPEEPKPAETNYKKDANDNKK